MRRWPTLKSSAAPPPSGSGSTSIFRQSNKEGELVDWIQEAHAKKAAGIMHQCRPATPPPRSRSSTRSWPCKLPVIEVHITNIHARESFRQNSYVSKAAKAVIAGFGVDGYALAITGLAGMIGAKAKFTRRKDCDGKIAEDIRWSTAS